MKQMMGKWGEDMASEFLENKGFQILDRNFHSRWGEIDIIARSSEYLIFTEVKTRSSVKFGTPAESVTLSKQKKLILTAEVWMQENHYDLQPRFDIIEIYAEKIYHLTRIAHITNAFEAEE